MRRSRLFRIIAESIDACFAIGSVAKGTKGIPFAGLAGTKIA